MLKKLFGRLTKSQSKGEDLARKEFILNVLLLGTVFLASVATLSAKISLSRVIQEGRSDQGMPVAILKAIALGFIALYFFSRGGKSKWVMHIFVLIFFSSAVFMSLRWGIDVPQALLIYAVAIVISGILVGTKFTFVLTVVASGTLIVLTFLQNNNYVQNLSYWSPQPLHLSDAVVYSLTLGIITAVSWLSNREIEKALRRARKSEKDLKKERDFLEVKVEERTEELKKVQIEKVLHLYRFADFGRITAGLFHDLVNPLTAISLNLEQLLTRSKGFRRKEFINTKSFIKQAILNTQHMERFVRSVRRQVQKQEVKKIFSLNEEVILVMNVLDHKATEKKVRINFVRGKLIKSYGNPTRFNQLVTNLVSNAIDACGDEKLKKRRKIIIRLFEKGRDVVLIVQDSGCGIPRKNIKKIFDPFFTTKSLEEGTGIGLYICQDIVGKDLKGKMKVRSNKGQGTTFTVRFPIRRVPVDSKV